MVATSPVSLRCTQGMVAQQGRHRFPLSTLISSRIVPRGNQQLVRAAAAPPEVFQMRFCGWPPEQRASISWKHRPPPTFIISPVTPSTQFRSQPRPSSILRTAVGFACSSASSVAAEAAGRSASLHEARVWWRVGGQAAAAADGSGSWAGGPLRPTTYDATLACVVYLQAGQGSRLPGASAAGSTSVGPTCRARQCACGRKSNAPQRAAELPPALREPASCGCLCSSGTSVWARLSIIGALMLLLGRQGVGMVAASHHFTHGNTERVKPAALERNCACVSLALPLVNSFM